MDLEKIISHYNIIGLTFGFSLGSAGSKFIFSIINDILIPITRLIMRKPPNFNFSNFISQLTTFVFVICTTLLVLKIFLNKLVTTEIEEKQKDYDKFVNNLNRIVDNGDELNKILKNKYY